MSTAIQKQQSNQLVQANYSPLEVRIALNQNLWGLPDDQVWNYYRLMCSHLKLDPASKPFDIISDPKQQRKVLYPNVSCSSQLGESARLSYGKLGIEVNEGMVALGFKVAHVSVEVRHPNGRSLVSEAFVDLMSGWVDKGQPPEPLKGNNLVNALKKAGTQCRRRGTLQMLGLVAPSEEIPTIKLGDMERAEGDAEGVIIEQPPAAALRGSKAEYDADGYTEAERAEEAGEPVLGATQEEFWEFVRERQISSKDAAPYAKQAAQGDLTWENAIAALARK